MKPCFFDEEAGLYREKRGNWSQEILQYPIPLSFMTMEILCTSNDTVCSRGFVYRTTYFTCLENNAVPTPVNFHFITSSVGTERA